MSAPTVGIFGLTGCAGDQLVILNCEDQLLDILGVVDVRDFLMASSENDEECHLDIAFVEGAVLSERDERTLKRVRERAGLLIAIGTCAVWGGVAAMDRLGERDEILSSVYGDDGRHFDTTPARALHEVVKVDGAITGCPIEKHEVIAAIANLLNGNPPVPVTTAVCAECRMDENNCLLTERGVACLGPVTAGGCNARCPSLGIPCVGCRGPAMDANNESLMKLFEANGMGRDQVVAKLATFAPLATGTNGKGARK